MDIQRITKYSEKLLMGINSLIPQLTDASPLMVENDLRNLLANDDIHLFIAINDKNEIIGMLTLVIYMIPTGKKAFVEDVVVDEKARGLKLGEKLLKKALEVAKENKVTKVELSSNPRRIVANALYQKNGFEIRKTNYYRLKL